MNGRWGGRSRRASRLGVHCDRELSSRESGVIGEKMDLDDGEMRA